MTYNFVTASGSQEHRMTFVGAGGKHVVEINLDRGDVTITGDHTEAAKVFWKYVETHGRGLAARVATLEKALRGIREGMLFHPLRPIIDEALGETYEQQRARERAK